MSNKITSSQRLPSRFAVRYSRIFTQEVSHSPTARAWSMPAVVPPLAFGTRLGVRGARCCPVAEIELHFCYHYPNVHDGYKKF